MTTSFATPVHPVEPQPPSLDKAIPQSPSDRHVLVVGGGIAGLSAAWQLQQAGLPYTLIEAAPRLGGMIQTATFDGFVAEGGPETFITRKPELWQLALQMGLQDSMEAIASETSGAAVLHNNQVMRVPLSPLLFLTSPLLSWRGKLRMMAEPLIPPRRDDQDETLASFARRRLGDEACDRLIAPILSGIYNSDAERQSILTTAAVMRDLEKHGSLIQGTLATARQRRSRQKAGEILPPRSVSFANGAQSLVEAIAKRLNGSVRLKTTITSLVQAGQGYRATLSNGETLTATALILALPANAATKLLQDLAPAAANLLAKIRFASIGTAALAFRADAMRNAPPVSSLMIPRRARRQIDAVLWRPQRAPAGHTLLRVFFGGAAPQLLDLDDRTLVDTIRGELSALLHITEAPLHYHIFRWPQGFPQADVGHLQLIDQIEAALPPTIALAGNSYRGIGVPDCVRQGNQAAERIATLVQHA